MSRKFAFAFASSAVLSIAPAASAQPLTFEIGGSGGCPHFFVDCYASILNADARIKPDWFGAEALRLGNAIQALRLEVDAAYADQMTVTLGGQVLDGSLEVARGGGVVVWQVPVDTTRGVVLSLQATSAALPETSIHIEAVQHTR